MRVIEIFHSVQGEGPFTGYRTSFVRTARCNLRCAWCDTAYSFGPGTERSIPSILREVATHRTRHACLTGGEPLLQKESVELLRRLSERGMTTVVETGGSLDVAPYLDVPAVVLSVDVKCPSSKMQGKNRWANLPLLRPTDVVKFVVADRKDYRYAKEVLGREPMPSNVVFQPVYGTNGGRLADWVLHDRLDVRVMVQEHKVLFGDTAGR
ncbi:MAG: radical SAM protein [Thermoplasmata archaeon]|nr:radical SAM protein [Thermoplasmata archaeon]MCI4333308.1 radical SAM protein [Thermoplasmata archaeon]